MRSSMMIVALAGLMLGVSPCKHWRGHGGDHGGGSAGRGGGEVCGEETCASGLVCCNESCGICTEPGGACTQQICDEEEVFCGGIAGIACPGAGTCVDDASDDCDPENGGADCGGLCECSGAAILCAPDTLFDDSPSVCACVPRGGETCGGLTGLPCGDGEFCNFPEEAQCGAADQTGTCEEIPQVCTREFNPVCGCDDTTYGNPCEAAANGVSIAHAGECEDGGSGQICGGFAALECTDPDEFCNFEPSAGGQGCDGTISDASGVCEVRPQACTLEYDPVCGCDRRTYGNACAAHAESVSVLHEGECTEIDCAEIGGHPVDGTGPGPMCPPGETDHGPIRYSNGMIAFEGTICCIP